MVCMLNRYLATFLVCLHLIGTSALADDSGLQSSEPEVPQRLVSTDGSLTEIVYALGYGSHLVGVDTTSTYPREAKELPQIGYKRALSVEGVMSLMPDMVLTTDDSGPAIVIDQLKQAGIKLQNYSAAPELASVKEKILGVSEQLGIPDQGKALWAQVLTQIELAMNRPLPEKPAKVLFVLSFSDRSPMVAGSETVAHLMINLAGGVNAASGFDGFKPISAEALVEMAPDVVLMMEGRNPQVTSDTLFLKPGFNQTPAASDQRLITMGGMMLLGLGPRTGLAIDSLNKALYSGQALVSAKSGLADD